jgi:alpha-tubulin suppressor-like RCC1 family protein
VNRTLLAACASLSLLPGCRAIVGIVPLSAGGESDAAGGEEGGHGGGDDARGGEDTMSPEDSPSGSGGDARPDGHAPRTDGGGGGHGDATVHPVHVESLAAGGGSVACAILSGGAAWCWGNNGDGQLGNGSNVPAFTAPVAVEGISSVTTISTGAQSTCAVLSSTVWCWGSDESGELGNGSTTVGEFGNVSNVPMAVPNVTGVTAVAVGNSFACVIANGAVQCWGGNWVGQLGDGTDAAMNATPGAVVGLSGTPTAITAGDSHACALLSGGTVQCWGWDESGQLGNGTTTASGVATPAPVNVSGLSGATAVAAGAAFTCALVADGAVECWGGNAGDLGNDTTVNSSTPVMVSGLSGVTSIAAAGWHACAILADGSVDCWGYTSLNQNEEFGNDATVGNGTTTPVAVPGLSGAYAIAVGGNLFEGQDFTCAALSAGSVECWGYNEDGQLGDGTMTSSLVPMTVQW